MRILFITTGSQATYYAAAPLATAARNAGHDVMLAAHEPWVETAEAIGLPTFCFTVDPIRHFMRISNPGKGLRFPGSWATRRCSGRAGASRRWAWPG